jgi:transposase-like protein
LFKKNGHIHNGKQNHQCKDCGRQFVVDATHREIGAEQRTVVERLLCEKISLHGICRTIGVSIRWLMDFIVARFERCLSIYMCNRLYPSVSTYWVSGG